MAFLIETSGEQPESQPAGHDGAQSSCSGAKSGAAASTRARVSSSSLAMASSGSVEIKVGGVPTEWTIDSLAAVVNNLARKAVI